MKKVLITLAALVAVAGTGFAGTATMSSGKTYKESKQVEEPTCFNDTELQIDTFGAYADGNAPNHAGPIRDHGWGGGVGVNYFFARYFGLGVDGIWLSAKENLAADIDNDDSKTFHSATGSVIFRYPIDSLCLAPYVFAGGGFTVDGDQWASGHAGVGVEYRVVPHKVGIFADARWNYYGTRYGHDDQNNFLAKVGFRVIF
jgi:hypothetical protein